MLTSDLPKSSPSNNNNNNSSISSVDYNNTVKSKKKLSHIPSGEEIGEINSVIKANIFINEDVKKSLKYYKVKFTLILM